MSLNKNLTQTLYELIAEYASEEYKKKAQIVMKNANVFNIEVPPPPVPKCVCGAQKTYGKKTVLAHHALWCDLRKG